jgi:hypothetical protein
MPLLPLDEPYRGRMQALLETLGLVGATAAAPAVAAVAASGIA